MVRDQFFGELMRAIIVRAVGKHDWQAIGMPPGADEMVGGSFGGGIG